MELPDDSSYHIPEDGVATEESGVRPMTMSLRRILTQFTWEIDTNVSLSEAEKEVLDRLRRDFLLAADVYEVSHGLLKFNPLSSIPNFFLTAISRLHPSVRQIMNSGGSIPQHLPTPRQLSFSGPRSMSPGYGQCVAHS